MVSKKKITVKFFPVLNKSDFENDFRIYCRLTYNRITTKFPMLHVYPGTKEEVTEFIDKSSGIEIHAAKTHKDRTTLGWRKKFIKQLVRKEISLIGNDEDSYSVRGFSDKFSEYDKTLLNYLCGRIYVELFKKLEDILTFRKYVDLAHSVELENQNFEYFRIFQILETLSKEHQINIKNALGDAFFDKVTALGYLVVFELSEQSFSTSDFLAFDKPKFYQGAIRIGEWGINLDDIKGRFYRFVDSGQAVMFLNRYSKKRFSLIAEKFDFDVSSLSSSVIDKFLYTEVERNFFKWELTRL